MNEFFTVDFLGTFAGMVAFVTLATQLIKNYLSFDPKWIALIVTIIGQLTVQFVLIKDFSSEGIALAIFNILTVLSASIATFETFIKPVERNKKN